MTAESFQKPEAVEKPPTLETAEQELAEINQEIGEFLTELETAEQNTESEELREQIKELKNEAKWTADWWAGNIRAFTNLVVGDGISFPALKKLKEETKQETPEEMLERVKKELAENGITNERKLTYKPGVSEVLERGITPFGTDILEKITHILPNLFFGNYRDNYWGINVTKETYKSRQDAWRLYLGMPQKNDTFEISDYQPKREKGLERNFSESYCYKLKDFWNVCLITKIRGSWNRLPFYGFDGHLSNLIALVMKGGAGDSHTYFARDFYKEVMGNFSFNLGKDEKGSYIAYDDIWDLDVFPENEKGFFGKPFHIYDRLYYDTETYEPKYE